MCSTPRCAYARVNSTIRSEIRPYARYEHISGRLLLRGRPRLLFLRRAAPALPSPLDEARQDGDQGRGDKGRADGALVFHDSGLLGDARHLAGVEVLRASVKKVRMRYRGRRQRTCENPDRAFCTSCLHGSESSLLGESSEASTSRRQLRPSIAMTLSMVSLRGRGVLASVRRREIHVGGFAVLILLLRRRKHTYRTHRQKAFVIDATRRLSQRARAA